MPELDKDYGHKPVLLRECLEALAIRPDGTYVDGTLGRAGHSLEILRRLTEGGRLIGIDRDMAAIEAARERLAAFSDRVTLVHGNFSDLGNILRDLGVEAVDGMLFDLGVSSPQLDEARRGFSYMHDAPLDMRMDTTAALDARQVVNTWSYEELRRILFDYGEERYAPQIARTIVRRREEGPIETTGELAELIRTAMPPQALREKQHPAKRSFQAIRIAVNGELEALPPMLRSAAEGLRPGGRLIPHAVPGAHGGKARSAAQLPGTGRLDRRETAAPAAQKFRHFLARLRPVRRAAEHLVAAAQRPGGDLQPDQAACPAPHLVRHRAKGCVLLFLPVRFRQKLHAVQKFPHSLAPQGGAGKAWEQPALPHQPPQFRKPFVRRNGSIQITREQIVVKRGQLLRERVVYFPGKAVEQDGGGAAFAAQLCECAGRVRAGTVDLVEEQQYRHVIVREKPPERFRVALHALSTAHDEDGVIERRKHALHLGGKIGVAGRVEKIINGVAPAKIRLSGKDGDPPLALDRLRVEEGVPVVDAPALPQSAAEVEKLLGERCFPRVDVGQDADADFSFRLPFFFFRHRKSSISNKTYCQYIMGVSPRRDMFLDDMIFLFLRPINSLTEEFSGDILRIK